LPEAPAGALADALDEALPGLPAAAAGPMRSSRDTLTYPLLRRAFHLVPYPPSAALSTPDPSAG
jgi:hypothetical protein